MQKLQHCQWGFNEQRKTLFNIQEKRRVVFEVERRTMIIHNVHEGIGNNSMAKALAAHRGRESTYQKISERFFWHGMNETLRNTLKFVKVANNKRRFLRRSIES